MIIGEIEKYLVGGKSESQSGIGHKCVQDTGVILTSGPNACPSTKVSNLHYVFCSRWGRKYPRQEVTKAWRLANRKAHEKYGVPITLLKNATRHSLVCQMINEGKTFRGDFVNYWQFSKGT